MRYHRLIRVISVLLCIFVFGIGDALAQSNEAANYQLFESIEALDVDGVKGALSRGADPNSKDPQGRFKALKYLITHLLIQGDTEDGRRRVFDISKVLLDHGAKIETYENDVLFFPISEGYVQLTKLLLDNGASPFRKFEGRSPMEWAVYYRQDAVVDLLEKYGVPKVTKEVEAQIRLIKAAGDYDIKGIIDALESGAMINMRDSSGQTALIQTLSFPLYSHEQLLALEYLLSKGADPNMTGKSSFGDDSEKIPIHIVVAKSTICIKKPYKGCDKIAVKIIRKLIEHGAKVSSMDSRGRTPLHLAAIYDNVVAARLLLEAGCRVMPKDALSKTPMGYAESKEMISLLKKHGAKELH